MTSKVATGIPSRRIRTAVFVVGIAFFLLFVGTNLYWVLYPAHWIVDCSIKDSSGHVISSRISPRLHEEQQVKDFIAWAERQGEKCTVGTVREFSPFRSIRLFR
jgi:hypothetical protein